MFVIFDPTAFATTISVAPLSAAAIDDASSGSDVPNPTISTPMANLLIPNDAPTCFAPTTNISAPRTRLNSAAAKYIVQSAICIQSICTLLYTSVTYKNTDAVLPDGVCIFVCDTRQPTQTTQDTLHTLLLPFFPSEQIVKKQSSYSTEYLQVLLVRH